MENQTLQDLKTRLARIVDLNGASGLLGWDQQTYMPPGGAQARGDQMGTLAGLIHEFFVDEEVGALLEQLAEEFKGADYDSDEVSLVRVNLREYLKEVRLPGDLVMEISKTQVLAQQAWQQARAENNFAHFQPLLDKTLELQLKAAEYLGAPSGNLYDALLDRYEPGMTAAEIGEVFSALKQPLVALVAAIQQNTDRVDDSVLHRHYPEKDQLKFSMKVVEALGFDFNRGRLDKSAHPFTGGTSRDDVRLTTRVQEDYLNTCLMATIHEAGHGMHRQNLRASLARTGLEHYSLGTAESQSRFYENVIGRSRPFWTYWYPQLQAQFPHLKDTSLDTFYRAINKSQPSLIRVEADEVTYGLHIMLRFELENALINGQVKVADLPEEWNARMQTCLGVTPSNDAQGVLQDVHWSYGYIGYFPTYLLGSIFAAQLWEAMQRDIPEAMQQVERGEFADIAAWQREKVQQHGGKFTLQEFALRATGKPLTWEPYMNYLSTKYGEVYGL